MTGILFTCYGSNMGVERIPKYGSAQKVDHGEEHSPAAPTRTRTRDFSIRGPALHHWTIPAAVYWTWWLWVLERVLSDFYIRIGDFTHVLLAFTSVLETYSVFSVWQRIVSSAFMSNFATLRVICFYVCFPFSLFAFILAFYVLFGNESLIRFDNITCLSFTPLSATVRVFNLYNPFGNLFPNSV